MKSKGKALIRTALAVRCCRHGGQNVTYTELATTRPATLPACDAIAAGGNVRAGAGAKIGVIQLNRDEPSHYATLGRAWLEFIACLTGNPINCAALDARP